MKWLVGKRWTGLGVVVVRVLCSTELASVELG